MHHDDTTRPTSEEDFAPANARVPWTPEQVGAWVRDHLEDLGLGINDDLDLAKRQKERALRTITQSLRELPSSISPHDLSKARWGLIFASSGAQSQILPYLQPLIALRRQQLGEEVPTYVRPSGQSGINFLKKYGETLGTIRPQKLPYYLLIVADPYDIPFEFQYQLSLSRAVGRIWFPELGDFKSYAEAVRKAETEGVERPRQARFFSTEHDETTTILGKELVNPLHLVLKENFPTWQTMTYRGRAASKRRLQSLLGGSQTPGLLLVACHGKSYSDLAFEEQRKLRGALLCHPSEHNEAEILTADDLDTETPNLHGLISFFFSCHGIGTPTFDNFPQAKEGAQPETALRADPDLLAERPFLSRLPVEMLRRGTLAVVGHIDRGWTTSFVWSFGKNDLNTTASLEDSLSLLVRGHRLGHAMRPLNRRYSQLATRLSHTFERMRNGFENNLDLAQLGFDWTAVNDARNLIVLGDPAVYLLGKRQVETTVRLDPELVKRIERQLGRTQADLETWVHRVLSRQVR